MGRWQVALLQGWVCKLCHLHLLSCFVDGERYCMYIRSVGWIRVGRGCCWNVVMEGGWMGGEGLHWFNIPWLLQKQNCKGARHNQTKVRKSVAKATERMTKKLVCAIFIWRFFFATDSEADCTCSHFNKGKTKPAKSSQKCRKSYWTHEQKTNLHYFFWPFFCIRFCSWAFMFTLNRGETKPDRRSQKCRKSYRFMCVVQLLWYLWNTFWLKRIFMWHWKKILS